MATSTSKGDKISFSAWPHLVLIQPLRRRVHRGKQSNKADCEEELSGYGERAEEGFSSQMALVAT
jgi:hypothetical protein